MQSEALSPRAFAERYGISRGTVFNMLKRGEIEAIRVGGSVRIMREHEQAWLARARIGSKEACDG